MFWRQENADVTDKTFQILTKISRTLRDERGVEMKIKRMKKIMESV